jgi:TRAP-type C4-dicarboxylate transport system permease small subunit
MKLIIDKVLGIFLVFLMSLMVFAVTWQVFSRYALQSSSSFTEEVARYLLIWIGLLGAAFISGQRQHLSIDILGPKLKESNRIKLRSAINVLIIGFSFFVLIIGGSNLVYVNYLLGQTSAALNIPLGTIYLALPLSGALVIVYKIIELLNPKKYLV